MPFKNGLRGPDPVLMAGFGARFRLSWVAIAGTMPIVLAWWGYKLAIIIASQAGFVRTAGVIELIALGLLAFAALLALLAALVPWPPARALAVALFGVTVLNATLTGLSVFYLTPRFAPKGVLAVVAAFAALLMVRFVRYDGPLQVFVARAITYAGLAGLMLTFLPAPWVMAGYLADQPHLPVSPLPPVGWHSKPDAPRRIVLISFDALRSRSTTLQNPTLDTTPNLQALAAESTTFTNTRAASDNTLVSLPTVLTGVRPNDYFPFIGNNSVYLRDGFLTGLGGFLAPAGYKSYYATMLVNPLIFGLDGEFTAGHMTSGMFRRNQFNTRAYLPLAATLGWTREKLAGHWDDAVDNEQDEVPATREAFSEGLAYLKQANGPTFLWLHLAVPHTPYHDIPKDKAEEPGDPRRYPYITERDVAAADIATLRRYEQSYLNYVRFGDAELGRFLHGLRASGLYDDTMVMVTADHGEEFDLPGHIPHGNGIATEDVTHVPLVIHLPGQHTAARVGVLVSHRDLVPTVLARVYGKVPPDMAGIPLLEGPLPADRTVFTWAMSTKYVPALKQAQTIAAYNGHYKYLVRYPTHEESLYDLDKDPEAETNLAARLPDVVARMRETLKAKIRP